MDELEFFLKNMSMSDLINHFDGLCALFAEKFEPKISDDALSEIRHNVFISLIEQTAEAIGTKPNVIFDSIKTMLELEEK